ncbi:uncharacterized protein BDZ99DRAFT_472725 [Mytilinidion resinicola]|uniref:Uncharacterized protein n=1 Tax=Mytilinidion resinicola TaxID=574789 RepID=A0A6A6Z382_9PEZI|nr:uncharacterized protein BDZ99DRAFT_472725 [Mytilinidion resinicola]KAF2815460.1 hypothetical protein BDZ99DRAFT_472725 [Mytilinidion resinicola]
MSDRTTRDVNRTQPQGDRPPEDRPVFAEHIKYMRKQHHKPTPKEWGFWRATGSYVIECEAVTGPMSDYYNEEKLTMDISETVKSGCWFFDVDFRFGVLEGTMLMETTPEMLDNVMKAHRAADGGEPEEEGDEDGDDDGWEEDEDPERYEMIKERYRVEEEERRKAYIDQFDHNPERYPRRIYFQWRGRDMRDATPLIQPDWDNAHVGYLDFEDNKCNIFEGKAELGVIGSNVGFRGYRVDKEPRKKAEPWNDLSEKAYEREWRDKVARERRPPLRSSIMGMERPW